MNMNRDFKNCVHYYYHLFEIIFYVIIIDANYKIYK